MSFPSQILSKPYLITSTDYQTLGTQINLVGVDDLQLKKENTKSYASPRMLNWVEPYEINGVRKSLFYTEINTNIQVGDRVWIINGYYDNDSLIKIDKYKKGRDGYKVLYVDECKIVLDIDYTGILPYNDSDKFDDFIKVYRISNRSEFINISRQISSRGGSLNYKFDRNQNNIVFIDSQDLSLFGPIYTEKNTQIFGTPSSQHIAGFGVNLGLTGSSGFFVKDGLRYWTNISKELFYYGSYSVALGTHSNNRMMVMNGDFNYKGFEFKEGYVYEFKYGLTGSYWEIDKTYSHPIISKANFRSGEFTGVFNNGLYGTQEKRITWKGGKSIWNGGTLLNTIWNDGRFDSNISLLTNYKSALDSNKNPYQKANSINNGGYGYNYIIDSYIKKSNIQNGNIINTKIGEPTTNSVLENHLKSITQNFYNNINSGYFEGCDFSSIYINNGTLVNSKINDTKLVNSKVINSQVYDSVIKDSSFISEDKIKIRAYDEWNISEYRYTNLLDITSGSSTYSIIQLSPNPNNIPNSRTTHKLYKLYIDEKDYKKLKTGYSFYLKGIKINDNSRNVLNFFDKKFKIGDWTEFIDDYTNIDINSDYNYTAGSFYKRGIEHTAYISTPGDNSYVLNSSTASVNLGFLQQYDPNINITTNKIVQYTNLASENPNSKYYSIDIIVSIQDIINRSLDVPGLNFNYDSLASTQSSTYLGNKIDISNAFIIDSNFESGIFETSDWNSGYNINYSNDSNISSLTGSGDYRLLIDFSSNTLIVQNTQYSSDNRETEFKQNDIIYLNSIDYINGSYSVRIPDTYKIISSISNTLILKEVNTNIISGLTAGGYFTTNNSKNRYNYISKVKFEKSRIKSGIFKRSYFSKSLIQNDIYDSSDRDYNNLDRIKDLVIHESIFSNNDNILSSGTYLNSFFIGGSDKWQDGIIQNSFINGLTFSKGTVKESHWMDGTFTGGVFYNSRTFDGNPSLIHPYYFNNRLKSYYIDGVLSATISNNRFAWVNGIFTGGEFYKSDWEDGLFTGGLFNYSKFYRGTFSGGNIGTPKSSISDTIIYNSDITYTTVDSATFYSKDPNYYGTSYSNINWYNGVFNNGVFGSSNDTIYTYITSTTYSKYNNIDTDINNNNQNEVGIIISTTSSTTDFINKDLPFEIKLQLKTDHLYTGDLLINLKAPNGNIINLKGLQEGGSIKLNNTIWSSNDTNQTLSQVSNYDSSSPPYFNFNMSKIIGTGSFGTYSYVSNTNNINDLLNSDSTFTGDWSLIIIDYYTGNTGKLYNWEITFNYNTIDEQIVFDNKATWYNGSFNGGQFIDMAKWKDGIFNGGKFISSYGWTYSGLYFGNSIDPIDYTWENGTFNDGEFGRGLLGDNSTWYNGIFNGGQFKGRLWNNGIFSNGNFYGSSTYSAIGGLNIDTYDSNAAKFVESYTQSFYGLWVDGFVTKNKDKYLTDKNFYFIDNKISKKYTTTNFSNTLWLSGTFSNETAIFDNSVWLSGTFNNGTFKNSSFNPYVNRGETDLVDSSIDFPRKLKMVDYKSFTPNFNPIINMDKTKDISTWLNGDLIESEFYMSKWYNGNFISGTAYGMVFLNGVSKFMNAYNVIWEGGIWKNGNWYGSNFEYSGGFNKSDGTPNNFLYNVVRRGMRDYGFSTTMNPGVQVDETNFGENNLHIWNLFDNSTNMIEISSISATNITFDLFSEDLNSNNYNINSVEPDERVVLANVEPFYDTNPTPSIEERIVIVGIDTIQ